MWPYTLSGRLPIIALVGRYPTNKLIGRELILKRPKALTLKAYAPEYYAVLATLSRSYSSLEGRLLTCYSPVRHSSRVASYSRIVRLACVRHAANVHSEPGSNSPIIKNSRRSSYRTNWQMGSIKAAPLFFKELSLSIPRKKRMNLSLFYIE